MTKFHEQLTKRFLLNLLRAILVLGIFVMSFHLSSIGSGGTAFGAVCLSILELVLPSACLVSALFTVGDLAHNHELTSLRAAGWSMLKMMWPVLLIGAASVPLSAVLGGVGSADYLPSPSDAATQTAAHASRAYPLVNLLSVIIGISLAATPRQRSTFVGFIPAAMVLGAYYLISATAHALGRHGGLPPIVAGWMATAALAGVAAVLWRRAEG